MFIGWHQDVYDNNIEMNQPVDDNNNNNIIITIFK